MNNPLVSVVIVSYNSARTIIETLESIKSQTYENLELIISDDKSKDNTTELVQNWLNANSYRFKYSKLISAKRNTGICGNLNRGVMASSGEWLKTLAGDDLLMPDAIETFVNNTYINPNDIYICKLELFQNNNSKNLDNLKTFYELCFKCAKETQEEQYRRIYHEYMLPGPGWFYSRKLYDSVGGFDESYPMMEEWPFALKVLKLGHKFYPIEKALVKYRVSWGSLSHSTTLPNYQLFKCLRKFFIKNQIPYLIKNKEYRELNEKSKYFLKTTIKFYLKKLKIKYK